MHPPKRNSQPVVFIYHNTLIDGKLLVIDLQHRDISFTVVEKTADLCNLAAEYQPDALILGLSFIEIEDGVLQALAHDPRTSAIPVLLITLAPSLEELSLQTLPPNVVVSFTKPLNISEFFYRLSGVLDGTLRIGAS